MSLSRTRYFAADGRFAESSQSFATFVQRDGGGNWSGMDTAQSRVAPGDRGHWESARGVLRLNYDDDMYSTFRYVADSESLLLTTDHGEKQLWSRA